MNISAVFPVQIWPQLRLSKPIGMHKPAQIQTNVIISKLTDDKQHETSALDRPLTTLWRHTVSCDNNKIVPPPSDVEIHDKNKLLEANSMYLHIKVSNAFCPNSKRVWTNEFWLCVGYRANDLWWRKHMMNATTAISFVSCYAQSLQFDLISICYCTPFS